LSKLQNIACVEDDPDIRAIAELALTEFSGFNVKSFPNGQSALLGVRQFAPQLILLDVMMPGMDGFEVLSKLREDPDTAHIPVIFMTAKAQRSEVERYISLGAIGVITKPFDPIGLSTLVAQIWSNATKDYIASEKRA
jgi:CheY-like chemotaxis protein